MTEQIVYIIDDDEAVLDSLNELVSSVGLSGRCYASALDFMDEYRADMAGCLVLDVRMAKMSGLALQKRLAEMGSTLPVIFITGYGDVPMAVEAMKGGAMDFIQKPYHEQHLLDSINAALQADLERREQASGVQELKQRIDTLTPREREVLALMAKGNSTRQLAELLAISPRTVEVHRQRVMNKTGLRSSTDFMGLARYL